MERHRKRHQLPVSARLALVVLAMVGAAALALGALVVTGRDRVASSRPVGSEADERGDTGGGLPDAGVEERDGEKDDALPMAMPDEVSAEGADLLAGATAERRWDSELPLREEAARVLREADERGDCVLARAGYLDLSGRVWGCVTQGSGWAEVCVVWERADGTGSEVRVWRLDASELAEWRGSG